MGRRPHAATATGSDRSAHRSVGEAARTARRRGAPRAALRSVDPAGHRTRDLAAVRHLHRRARPARRRVALRQGRRARPIPARTITCPGRSRAWCVRASRRIRKEEFGFRTVEVGPPARYQDVDAEALMLTGDENIVKLEFIVQYKVRTDASGVTDFLFNVRDPDGAVRAAAEAAMREVIGRNGDRRGAHRGQAERPDRGAARAAERFSIATVRGSRSSRSSSRTSSRPIRCRTRSRT